MRWKFRWPPHFGDVPTPLSFTIQNELLNSILAQVYYRAVGAHPLENSCIRPCSSMHFCRCSFSSMHFFVYYFFRPSSHAEPRVPHRIEPSRAPILEMNPEPSRIEYRAEV